MLPMKYMLRTNFFTQLFNVLYNLKKKKLLILQIKKYLLRICVLFL